MYTAVVQHSSSILTCIQRLMVREPGLSVDTVILPCTLSWGLCTSCQQWWLALVWAATQFTLSQHCHCKHSSHLLLLYLHNLQLSRRAAKVWQAMSCDEPWAVTSCEPLLAVSCDEPWAMMSCWAVKSHEPWRAVSRDELWAVMSREIWRAVSSVELWAVMSHEPSCAVPWVVTSHDEPWAMMSRVTNCEPWLVVRKQCRLFVCRSSWREWRLWIESCRWRRLNGWNGEIIECSCSFSFCRYLLLLTYVWIFLS